MKMNKFSFFRTFRFELKITFTYFIFGMLWILFSDELLDLLVANDSLLTKFQTYKGTFFIIMTSVFLYFFVRKHIRNLKRVESKRIESESHYKALFNDNHSVIVLINPANANIEDANPAACKYYGWTHAEICTKNVSDFNIMLDNDQAIARLQSVESYNQSYFVSRHRLASGEIRDVEIFSGPIHIGERTLLYSTIQDITDKLIVESELRKLSKAVEQSPVAIFITNPEGIIEYVNPRVTQLTGFSANELINKNPSIFASGEKSTHEYAELWITIQSGNIWSGEFHNRKKTGELYWESATISPIFDTTGKITHFLAIKEDITDRKNAQIALNKSEELLRNFASHLQNVREEEKVALAREIHDDLGQTLVALKIDTGLLKNKVARLETVVGSTEISDNFVHILAQIDITIKTARRIMSGLRPELLEINGFVGATPTYLREFEERHQISCEFVSEISRDEMDSQQSLVFFRILQESLNNIAKHSKATQVKVLLRAESNKLIFEIIDNGTGFDRHNCGRQDSYGMIGMKERVVLLDGELDIESEIGKGTCVRVEIPWTVKQEVVV